jgi:hypothetical protein
MNRALQIRARTKRPEFVEFRQERVRALMRSGVTPAGARLFAKVETETRAKISFIFTIDEALAAELQVDEGLDQHSPRFRLVLTPS